MRALLDPSPGPPPGRRRAVAVLSIHASPLAELGRGENGGMNLAVRRLCEEMSARGVPTDVFVRRDDPGAPAEQLIAPGSRLVLVDAGPAEPLPKAEVLRWLPILGAAVLRHAESERRLYRLVHSHYWLSGFVASRLASRWQIPWVHSAHTLARLKAEAGLPLDGQRADVEAVLAGRADRLVAVSEAEAAALRSLYGVDSERVCVVPPGVDSELFAPRALAPLRTRWETDGRRVVLFAGRLEPLKGLDLLLDAVARLRADPDFADTLLLCAGADSGDGRDGHPGGERERLQARVDELGIGDAVRFLGAVSAEDLAGLDALADVVAVPSMTETFGLVALEAQAAGTPVVASSVGGLRDAVVHDVSGLLVEGREPADFAAALACILADPGRRARLSEGARTHAAGLTWARSAERLLHLYDCVEEPQPVAAACVCLA